MQKLYLIFLLLFLNSCSENCEGIDCLSQDSFSFTIKSADTGDDLIFGNEPQISEEEIAVFYFLNGNKETAFVHFQSDNILIPLNPEVNEYFVEALNETDTLKVRFLSTDESECCPSTTEIKEIQVNGKVVDDETWEVIALYR
jgi:predicted neutral ceramidase superfamily lipid hydrolase